MQLTRPAASERTRSQLDFTSKLAGFKSRWITPAVCINFRPAKIWYLEECKR